MFVIRLALKFVLTALAVWFMILVLPDSFLVGGGLRGVLVVALTMTLLNVFVRVPIDIVTYPLRFISALIVIIAINLLLLWLAVRIVNTLDPAIASLAIRGGIAGWLIAACVFGFVSWLVRLAFRGTKE